LPFIQQVTYLDKRVLTLDTPALEYLTSDEKRIRVDQVTRWRINDPRRFFLTSRTEADGQRRLRPLVESELRAQIAKRPYDEMISAKRDSIMDVIRVEVAIRADLNQLGVEIIDVRTKRADLPEAVEQSVYDRMQSARRIEADRHRADGQRKADAITAETDRAVAVMLACADRVSQEVRGDGDARAIAIFAQALKQDPEFFSFLRRLEAYPKSFHAGDRLILSTDSNFLRLLSGESVAIPEVEATTGSVQPLSAEVVKSLTAQEADALIVECIPETE
jgi:membrane protease subunit HflC